jgi:hypothetical protein
MATRCPGCGMPLKGVVNREAPPVGDEVAHFLVPMAQCWDDVVQLCHDQRLFCCVGCVQRLSESTGAEPGYVMNLAVLWRLASRWYESHLLAGYERRESVRALEVLPRGRASGPFWGLDQESRGRKTGGPNGLPTAGVDH